VLVLSVTASRANQIPSVIFKQLENISDFHLLTSTTAKFNIPTSELSNAKAERTRPASAASGSEDPSQADC